MKICYDYEIFWKQKFSGVASRYYFNLIKYLSYNQNLKIKVFANIYLNERIENLPSKNNHIKFSTLLYYIVSKEKQKEDIKILIIKK